jgi:hypothetical protein
LHLAFQCMESNFHSFLFLYLTARFDPWRPKGKLEHGG